MLARDIMAKEVVTVRVEDSAADLTDLFQRAHVHGAPVVDGEGNLVGMVSQEDILIGGMSSSGEQGSASVREIMTAPAISAAEHTPVSELCRLMWRLRIHHIPIVRDGKVVGMVSSLDICRAIADGQLSG